MQLYLNSLTQTKLAVFLFPQITAQNEVCHSHLAFSWAAAGSALTSRVAGEFVI